MKQMKIARKNFVIPTGGKIDQDYLEAISEEMADIVVPKTIPARLQD